MIQNFDQQDYVSRCIWVNGPVLVGAGPSGLAISAGLKKQGVPFVVLERANCIASLWKNHTYDRLKLHLPKQFCQLPYFPFPDNFPEYPTKVQFIDYLESYAKHFEITPRFNESVQSAKYDETCGLWQVKTISTSGSNWGEVEYICRWLVVATGENAEKVVPEFEGLQDFGGSVMHACDYKSGESYQGKRVLVVGCGNSGMEVSLDLCNHKAIPSMVVRNSVSEDILSSVPYMLVFYHQIQLSESEFNWLFSFCFIPQVHVLPREVLGRSTFELAVLMMKWLPLWLVDKILLIIARLLLGNIEKYGLRRPSMGPLKLKNTQGKTPVLDIGALERIRSGEIRVVPGIKRFSRGRVEFVNGENLEMDCVILATGYCSNVPSWLKVGTPTEFITL